MPQDTAATTDTPPAPAEEAAGAAQLVKAITEDPVDTVTKLMQKATDWSVERGPAVLAALVLLVAAWVLAGWTRKFVIASLLRARLDLTLAKFFGNLARWAIIIFAIVTCLGTLGINTTSIAALVAAAGLTIGLALQGNLGNLASGVLLLIFRPFKIGDVVIVAGHTGVVDGIDLFTTNLDTADNRRIIVPNGAIFSGVIENQTRHPRRRVDVNVPVAIAADMDRTRQALESAVERVIGANIGALRDPAPSVTLMELVPMPMWTVMVWAETARVVALRPRLLREIKLAVDEAGIGPTPPVQHLHIRSMPGQGG